MRPIKYPIEIEKLEIELLMDGVWKKYGYDFRDYAPESFHRRIWKTIVNEKLSTVSALLEKLLHDPACMKRFLTTISVDYTTMFRDPSFYLAFRQQIVPILRDLHHLKIWHAGCASGEEVYSMAILLKEEGLLDKTRIYATDMNDVSLAEAKAGIYPLSSMKDYTANYLKAGGNASFSDYYTARYGNVTLKSFLKKNIVWSQHNLVTDWSFNEFDCILCRNVLIYFSHQLQNKVIKLFYESLPDNGVLILGKKESLSYLELRDNFEIFDVTEKIFLKKAIRQ